MVYHCELIKLYLFAAAKKKVSRENKLVWTIKLSVRTVVQRVENIRSNINSQLKNNSKNYF